MTPIRFRGKDAKTGEWLYGYYVEQHLPEYDTDQPDRITGYTNLPMLFNDEPGQRDGCYWHEVVYNTVGQFSTLRDKNGKEIYAGDIIYSEFLDGSNCHCLVGWNDEEACFGLMDEYAFRSKQVGFNYPKFDSLLLLNFRNHGTKFEVVGNIHDNPELIKRK